MTRNSRAPRPMVVMQMQETFPRSVIVVVGVVMAENLSASEELFSGEGGEERIYAAFNQLMKLTLTHHLGRMLEIVTKSNASEPVKIANKTTKVCQILTFQLWLGRAGLGFWVGCRSLKPEPYMFKLIWLFI